MVQGWLLLVLEVDPEWVDLLSGVLFEAGAAGLEERDQGGRVELLAYAPDEQTLARWASAARAALARLEANRPSRTRPARLEVRTSTPSAWEHEWTRYLEPELLGRSFVIQPLGNDAPAPSGRRIIFFEPRLCFGVGSHPSTQLSARSLERLCRRRPGARVLDVGTGTGVLAMVALLSGASWVAATDIDAIAVAAARRNLELNQLQDRCRVMERPLTEITERFDLVVANLEARALVDESRHLAEVTSDGGCLVVSGLLRERAEEVAESLQGHGLVVSRTETLHDWCAIELVRKK
jgi:ribosomal protein L11 methyltransferase